MTSEAINSFLSTSSVVLAGLAIQFRNAGKAQRKALKELRDRDILWAIYVHDLRVLLAAKTGESPPEIPKKLHLSYSDVE